MAECSDLRVPLRDEWSAVRKREIRLSIHHISRQLVLRLVKTQNGYIFHRRLDHNFQVVAVEKPPKGNLVLMTGRIEGHLVHFKIKIPVMNFLGACVNDNVLGASMRLLNNQEESEVLFHTCPQLV